MIRLATILDIKAIRSLLEQAGYRVEKGMLQQQVNMMLGYPHQQLLVYEVDNQIVAFAAIHFIIQMAYDGELVFISSLVVAEQYRNRGIGTELEEYILMLARERKCDRIQVHSQDWQNSLHRFYGKHGYTEYPKYFSKRLMYAE